MEYLTSEEHKALKDFLDKKSLSNIAVSSIVNRTPANVGYWFRKERFKRLVARELIKVLKGRALEGFDDLDF